MGWCKYCLLLGSPQSLRPMSPYILLPFSRLTRLPPLVGSDPDKSDLNSAKQPRIVMKKQPHKCNPSFCRIHVPFLWWNADTPTDLSQLVISQITHPNKERVCRLHPLFSSTGLVHLAADLQWASLDITSYASWWHVKRRAFVPPLLPAVCTTDMDEFQWFYHTMAKLAEYVEPQPVEDCCITSTSTKQICSGYLSS